MNQYVLTRSYLQDRTIGQIKTPNGNIATLERPWVNNAINISCIPEGTYKVKRDNSGKFRYYSVTNVANRSLIEIHPANYPNQLAGCIALGEFFSDKFDLINSRRAVSSFLELQGDVEFTLIIRQFNPFIDEWLL